MPEKFLRKIRRMRVDWSGVISDDRRPVHESNSRMLERRGVKRFSYEDWLFHSTASVYEFFSQRGFDGNPEVLTDEYLRTYKTVCAEGLVPHMYPDAPAFFDFIAALGISNGVISAHPPQVLEREASEYGLCQKVGCLTGGVKDKSSVMRTILFDTDPEQFLYLGDTIFDIRSAKAAGVRSVAITTGYHSRERLAAEHPDLIVDSLTELADCIGAAAHGALV